MFVFVTFPINLFDHFQIEKGDVIVGNLLSYTFQGVSVICVYIPPSDGENLIT